MLTGAVSLSNQRLLVDFVQQHAIDVPTQILQNIMGPHEAACSKKLLFFCSRTWSRAAPSPSLELQWCPTPTPPPPLPAASLRHKYGSSCSSWAPGRRAQKCCPGTHCPAALARRSRGCAACGTASPHLHCWGSPGPVHARQVPRWARTSRGAAVEACIAPQAIMPPFPQLGGNPSKQAHLGTAPRRRRARSTSWCPAA